MGTATPTSLMPIQDALALLMREAGFTSRGAGPSDKALAARIEELAQPGGPLEQSGMVRQDSIFNARTNAPKGFPTPGTLHGLSTGLGLPDDTYLTLCWAQSLPHLVVSDTPSTRTALIDVPGLEELPGEALLILRNLIQLLVAQNRR